VDPATRELDSGGRAEDQVLGLAHRKRRVLPRAQVDDAATDADADATAFDECDARAVARHRHLRHAAVVRRDPFERTAGAAGDERVGDPVGVVRDEVARRRDEGHARRLKELLSPARAGERAVQRRAAGRAVGRATVRSA
jgi:hypothetical protein